MVENGLLSCKQYLKSLCGSDGLVERESLFGAVALLFETFDSIYTLRDSAEQRDLDYELFSKFLESQCELWLLHVDQIPSWKFLPLIGQFTSRLEPLDMSDASKFEEQFQSVIFRVVHRCLVEHPFHSVYHLIALENLDAIPEHRRQSDGYLPNMQKSLASRELLNSVMASESLSSKVIKLARIWYSHLQGISNRQRAILQRNRLEKSMSISKELKYLWKEVRELGIPLVLPTVCPPISRTGYLLSEISLYSTEKLSNTGAFASSGINCPLFLSFVSSSGISGRVLLKSEDDLRQDSVMEQVFVLVNQLLILDPRTRGQLQMRTYNVIPLSPNLGLVEIIPNCQSLGSHLIRLHKSVYPDDWDFQSCRKFLEQTPSSSCAESRLREVFHHVRPVMRFLFQEISSSPEEHLRLQRCFSISLAVGSVVGYLVGLGDRHLQNILLDASTGELVHIDLGVAFESGRHLSYPELIPFRLTRDLLDGLGVLGIDGIFKNSFLGVLDRVRESRIMLVTILGVLVHDPVYRWSVGGEGGICEAKSAVLRVDGKLLGRVDGLVLGLEGQFRTLVSQAVDMKRLARLFPGWAPWC